MNFETYEINAYAGRRVYARHDTFDEAWQALCGRPNIVCAEIDVDHPDCADALLANGVVLSIAPSAAHDACNHPGISAATRKHMFGLD